MSGHSCGARRPPPRRAPATRRECHAAPPPRAALRRQTARLEHAAGPGAAPGARCTARDRAAAQHANPIPPPRPPLPGPWPTRRIPASPHPAPPRCSGYKHTEPIIGILTQPCSDCPGRCAAGGGAARGVRLGRAQPFRGRATSVPAPTRLSRPAPPPTAHAPRARPPHPPRQLLHRRVVRQVGRVGRRPRRADPLLRVRRRAAPPVRVGARPRVRGGCPAAAAAGGGRRRPARQRAWRRQRRLHFPVGALTGARASPLPRPAAPAPRAASRGCGWTAPTSSPRASCSAGRWSPTTRATPSRCARGGFEEGAAVGCRGGRCSAVRPAASPRQQPRPFQAPGASPRLPGLAPSPPRPRPLTATPLPQTHRQIHGTCLGFQLLHILVSNVSRNDLLIETDSVAHATTMELTAAAGSSRTFGNLPADLTAKVADPRLNLILQNHEYGAQQWGAARGKGGRGVCSKEAAGAGHTGAPQSCWRQCTPV
jgi:hypothetical protein